MNLAQLDLQEKNPQAARRRLEAVLAKDKDNVQALLELGMEATDGTGATLAWPLVRSAAALAPPAVTV